MSKLRPTGITADRADKTMTVVWSDGHTSIYPFGLLRNACPCAECRGGHHNMTPEPGPDVFDIPLIDDRSTEIREIKPVGNYAINIVWGDGHHFGIYNWSYLRSLCPCEACQSG